MGGSVYGKLTKSGRGSISDYQEDSSEFEDLKLRVRKETKLKVNPNGDSPYAEHHEHDTKERK